MTRAEKYARLLAEAYMKGTPAIWWNVDHKAYLLTGHRVTFTFRANEPSDLFIPAFTLSVTQNRKTRILTFELAPVIPVVLGTRLIAEGTREVQRFGTPDIAVLHEWACKWVEYTFYPWVNDRRAQVLTLSEKLSGLRTLEVRGKERHMLVKPGATAFKPTTFLSHNCEFTLSTLGEGRYRITGWINQEQAEALLSNP